MLKYFILVCALSVGFGIAASLPSYLKKCPMSKDFDACALKHGKEAIPKLLKGDKRYEIPVLVPLFFPVVSLDAGSLKITLTDTNVYGLENVDLQGVSVDFDAQKLKIAVKVPLLTLIGKYDMNGQILVLPIKGDGPYNVTAIDGVYQYEANYKIEEKQGKEYIVPQEDDKLDLNLGKAIFKFENLFNGDEKLGDQMNMFLNENWKDVVEELGGVVGKTVSSIVRAIFTGFAKKVPYEELFLIEK